MKKTIYLLSALSLLLFSCTSEATEDSTKKDSENSEKKSEINISEFKELAVEPCNLLTEEMITSRFEVGSEELENDNDFSKKGKLSPYSVCKYSWKKPNFEEIQERNLEKLMESSKKSMETGDTKGSMNTAMNLEKPKFFVGLTNIKIFENEEKAKKRFELLHQVPEKKDMEKLNQEIDKQDTLSDQSKEVGKNIAGGIASNMKFEKVEGVGTAAYWDFMSNKLDILYGTIQIGVVVHVSENHDQNVDAAKEIANEIMGQF